MNLDILAFGAHPDDVEISMGGTILHYIEEGKKVGVIDITEGELGTRGSVETRYAESEQSSELLGIHMRHNLQLKDGFFQHNEENLKKIIQQIRRLKPESDISLLGHRDPGFSLGRSDPECMSWGIASVDPVP